MVTYKPNWKVVLEFILSILMTILTTLSGVVIEFFVLGKEDSESDSERWKYYAKLLIFFLLISIVVGLLLNYDNETIWIEEFTRGCLK